MARGMQLTDRGQDVSHDPGLIGEETVTEVIETIQKAAKDEVSIAEWFGSFITDPGGGPGPWAPSEKRNAEICFVGFWLTVVS